MKKYTTEVGHLLTLASWGEISWDGALKEISDITPACGISIIHSHASESKQLSITPEGIKESINSQSHTFFNHHVSDKEPLEINQSSGISSLSSKFSALPSSGSEEIRLNNDKKNNNYAGVKYKIRKNENISIGIYYRESDMKGKDFSSFLENIKTPFYHAIRTTINIIDKSSKISSQLFLKGYSSTPGIIVKENLEVVEINEAMREIIGESHDNSHPKKHYKNSQFWVGITEAIKDICSDDMPAESVRKIDISHRPFLFTFTRVDTDFGKPLFDTESLILITAKSLCHRTIALNHSLLHQLYSLTNTEIALCQALIDGNNLRSAAGMTKISYEHARQRLKTVLQKTCTHSQSSLMILLTRISL